MSVEITSSVAHNMPNPENCNKLGIVVEEAAHPRYQRCLPWGAEGTYKRHIYMAAASGNWSEASSYHEIHPNWVCTPLTAAGNTALHVAVSMGQISFVAKLVECMSMEDLEIHNADGNTAFCMAVISGNVEIASILLRKNPRVVWIRGSKEMLPIHLASSYGHTHTHVAEFLFQNTREDLHNLPFQDIVRLFFLTITNSSYTMASKLLARYPKLATTENEEGLTALQLLAQFSFYEEAPGYLDILSSLFWSLEREESLNSIKPSKTMFDAAKSGNLMILEFLFKYNPDLLMEVNSSGQSLLHIAILYRQEAICRLILSKGASKNVMMHLVDFDGNNILHLAGKLVHEGRFGSSTNHVLMHSEELWFQEVEKIVPPALKIMRNKDGWTPKELFYWEHNKLSREAVSGLNGIANTFIVVATLVISLGITGALTIPIRDTDSAQTPFFRRKTWYTIFFLSSSTATCFCSIAMIFYASLIFPSSWMPKHEFVGSKQTKLIYGNLALLASLAIISVATSSGSILIYDFLPNWVFSVNAALGGIPLVLGWRYLVKGNNFFGILYQIWH